MKFRTEITPRFYPIQIDFSKKIFGLGSCFVVNIKEKLDFYKFQNKINDFGTIFNPHSIHNIIERTIKKRFFDEDDIFFYDNIWKSYELHSIFNQIEKDTFLDKINNKINENHNFIKQTDFVIFTYGTAWVYQLKDSGKIVSNCHKIPQKYFEKKLLKIDEISNNISSTINLIRSINPNVNFILTISPVRHLKDGFVENQRSKSRLIEAVHSMVDNNKIFYFPSYEILMDDLRDYRFYNSDLLHPNNQAVEYVWEIFYKSLIDKRIEQDIKLIEKVQKQLAHRNFINNDNNDSKLLNNIKQIEEKYPWMKF